LQESQPNEGVYLRGGTIDHRAAGRELDLVDFWNSGTGGRHFVSNGQALGAQQDNYVSASQLTQTTYQSGSGADTLWVRVSDGALWSAWPQSFTVTAPIDTGPVVVPTSTNLSATHNQSFAVSSLFIALRGRKIPQRSKPLT
jgi:hypothetical protein